MPLTSVAFYLETLHSALQGDCQWQALALLFHLFGSPALEGSTWRQLEEQRA